VDELGLLDCEPHELLELEELGLEEVAELGEVVVVVVVVWPVAGLVADCVMLLEPVWLLLSDEGVLLCEAEGDEAELEEEGELAEFCDALELSVLLWLLDCAMKLLCGGPEGELGLFDGFVPVGGFSLMLPLEPLGLLWVASAPVAPVVLEVLELLLPTLDEPAAELLPEFDALELATVKSSLTFLTPGTDFASFLACFLSSLLETVPVKETVPLSTLICTLCRFGFVASCS
jgi:hypothetical protein